MRAVEPRERARLLLAVRTTVAMSRTRTGLPLRSATMRSSKASTDSMRPSVRRPSSWAPAVRRPPGISTFWRWSASFSCWMERLKRTSLSGSTTTWISRFRSPTRVMAPTSLTVSSARLIRLSAISVISRARALAGDDQGQDRRRVGIDLLDDGRLGARGKRDSTAPTFSRTSLAASCTLRSSTKVAKTCDCPSMVDGAQLVEAADGVDDLLDLLGDLALDLLGRGAGQARGDGDGRQVHLGEDVHAELDEGGQPEHDQGGDEHGREDRPADEDLEEAHCERLARLGLGQGDGRAVEELGEVRDRDRLARLHAPRGSPPRALARPRP